MASSYNLECPFIAAKPLRVNDAKNNIVLGPILVHGRSSKSLIVPLATDDMRVPRRTFETRWSRKELTVIKPHDLVA
jgi:hypothetical protein